MSGSQPVTVRFWDPARQFEALEPEITNEILSTLRQGDLIMRRQLEDFERGFASLIGRRHCVGVSNCTDGLRLTLEALEIGPGDEVITVAHTFVATIAAIHHVGATPVLVDVGDDHLMDVEALAEAINDKTRAVIPVHLNGRTCDMARIVDICRSEDLKIVEDAAQAVGARIDDRNAGTFGVAATYSFYPAKLLGALGDAGAVVTDDDRIADRLRLLRDHGRATKSDLASYGWNCRLDNLQAAVLNLKLSHVPAWIERRREIAGRYEEALATVNDVRTLPGTDGGRWYDVYQNYVIESEFRDDLRSHLARLGVETLISWPIPNHRQPGLALDHFSLPRTEQLCREVLSLPLYPEMPDDDVEHVINAIRDLR